MFVDCESNNMFVDYTYIVLLEKIFFLKIKRLSVFSSRPLEKTIGNPRFKSRMLIFFFLKKYFIFYGVLTYADADELTHGRAPSKPIPFFCQYICKYNTECTKTHGYKKSAVISRTRMKRRINGSRYLRRAIQYSMLKRFA